MSHQVLPLGQRPLLFRRTVDYSKVVVHKVTALDDQTYHMLFIGTGVFKGSLTTTNLFVQSE